jgi:hypothetical protein
MWASDAGARCFRHLNCLVSFAGSFAEALLQHTHGSSLMGMGVSGFAMMGMGYWMMQWWSRLCSDGDVVLNDAVMVKALPFDDGVA